MAVECNITRADGFFLGEDKLLSFTIYAADGVTPEDISGWTLEWALRSTPGTTGDPDVEKTDTDITIGAGGVCSFYVLAADTEALEPGAYWHTLCRVDVGNVTVLSFGTVVLQERWA